jgi:hypothetical protein
MCSENGDEPTTSTGRRLGRALSALLTGAGVAAALTRRRHLPRVS